MYVDHIELSRSDVPLSTPYATAYGEIAGVTLFVVRAVGSDGSVGFGSASPATYITGETVASCERALQAGAHALRGEPLHAVARLSRTLARALPGAPAAQIALDAALHDLAAQQQRVPLVDYLGRAHTSLPTAITLGILPVDTTLDIVSRHLDRGLRIIKLKLGRDVEADIERVRCVHARLPTDAQLLVDPNSGYAAADFARFARATASLDRLWIEQPTAQPAPALRASPDAQACRDRLVVDEGLVTPADALALMAPPAACRAVNVKLMKCGAVQTLTRLCGVVETGGGGILWGCMDESRVSITAALHVALATPASIMLDLDGCFDLGFDFFDGGFVLEQGRMRALDVPGIGVTPRGETWSRLRAIGAPSTRPGG